MRITLSTLLPGIPVPRWGTVDAEIRGPPPTLPHPLGRGAHDYQRFLLSKSGVGQNIALHAAPAPGTSTDPVSNSAFPIHSTVCSPKLLPS